MKIGIDTRHLIIALGLILFQQMPLLGQSRSLESLVKQWQSINQQLDEVESKIESDSATEELTNQRKNLIADAKRQVETLESAARAKLEANGESQLAFQLLMGIALEAASKDDDAKALELGQFVIHQGINRKYFEIASKSDRLSLEQREIFDELQIRYDEAMKNDLPWVKVTTNKGEVILELFENEAPATVGNFVSLCESGFYDNKIFHRVIEGFVAQTGGFEEPGKGDGGPGYQIKCECYRPEKRQHFSGCLSMAHRNVRDSGGSQFYIPFTRISELDGRHTVFGRVLKGFDVLENLERTHTLSPEGEDIPLEGILQDKILKVEVIRKRDHPYTPVKVDDETEQKDQEEASDAAGDSNLELNSPSGDDK